VRRRKRSAQNRVHIHTPRTPPRRDNEGRAERDHAGGEAAVSAAAGSTAAGGIAESAGITAALDCGELLPACGEPPPAAIMAALAAWKLLAPALSARDEDGSAAELLAREVDAPAALLARAAASALATPVVVAPAPALEAAWAVPVLCGSLIRSSSIMAKSELTTSVKVQQKLKHPSAR
jgi:hypothetical protein